MKLISKCLVTLLSVTTILMFTACSTASEPHVHSFGSYSFDAAYSSGDTGTMTRTCSGCNQKDTITVKVLSVSEFISQLGTQVTRISADAFQQPGITKNADETLVNVNRVALTGSFGYADKFPSSLTEADLSGLITSQVTSFEDMFKDCSSLTSVNLSNIDSSKITSMISMFQNCESLTSLDLTGLDTSNVTSFANLFNRCYNLTTITFGNWNTSKVTKMNSMFYECKKIKSLDLSFMNTKNVTDMSSMFQNCYALESLNVSSFDTSKVTDMTQMFLTNKNLVVLDLRSFNTSSVTKMIDMFSSCSKLKTIYANDFDIRKLSSTNQSLFHNCYELTGAISYNRSSPVFTEAYANTTTGYFTKPQ